MAEIGILQVRVEPDMGGFQQQVSGAMRNIAQGARAVGAQVTRDLAGLGATMAATGAAAAAGLAIIGIKTAAGLETATLQFQTLLGSADEAKAKVAELFDFAKKTPFESGPVIEASRRLQVFGGDALNTADNLRLIGDAAAATSAPIEEVAFWVGRAYSQIKGGQPFGEAAMRLQELGVLTPEVRTEMERLSEAGASSEEVFAQLQGQLDQFNGAMELQANTLAGLTSTIKDQFNIGLATAFQPAFEALKEFLSVLRDFGDTDVFDRIMQDAAVLGRVFLSVLNPAIDQLKGFLDGLTTSDIDDFFVGIADKAADVVTVAQELYATFEPLAPVIAGVGLALFSMFANAIPVIGLFIQPMSGLTGALLGFSLGIEANREALMGFLDVIGSAARGALPALGDAVKTITDNFSGAFQAALKNLTPAFEYWVSELFPTLATVAADLSGPLAEVVDELTRLAGGVLTEIGPMLEAIARGAGAILGAGLSVLADILGVLADNAELVAPALVGVAAAFAAFKIAGWVRDFDIAKSSLSGIVTAVQQFRVQMSLAPPDTGMFTKLTGAAQGSAAAIGGIGSAVAGLGIGVAVTAGVALLTQHFQRQAQEAKINEAQIDSLAEAYIKMGDTAATTADWLRDQLRTNQDLSDSEKDRMSTLAELAGGYDELGEALDSNGDAYDDLTGSVQDYAMEAGGFTDAQQRIIEESGLLDEVLAGNASAVDQLRQLLGEPLGVQGGISAGIRDMQSEFGPLNALLGEYATTTDRAGDKANELESDQEAAARQTNAYREAIDNLKFSLDRLTGEIDVADAQRATAEAFANLSTVLAENGHAWDINTEAGRANQDAAAATRDMILRQVEALALTTIGAEGAAAAGRELYDTLVNQVATAFGITTDEAAVYLEQIGLTPEIINTTAQYNDEQARADLYEYWTQLDLTPDNLPTVADFWKAQAEGSWASWVATLGLTPEDALTLAQFLDDQALGDIEDFREVLDALNGKTIDTYVNFRPTSQGVGPGGGGGVPMGLGYRSVSPEEAGLMAAPMATTSTVATGVLGRRLGLSAIDVAGANGSPVLIENRTYLGQTEVTDVVKTETVAIQRDRSMKYLAGVG